MQIKKQLLKPDTEKMSGSKLRKEYDKAVYYHPVYLTSMQSTSCEMPGWMKHKLESKLPGEISITSDMQTTPTPVFLPGESQERGSLVGCHLWGHTESDTTEVT